MMPLKNLNSPEAIRAAMSEYDRLGRTYFLEKYGYGKSRDYMLRDRHSGKLYDAAAVVGVAYGVAFPDTGPLRSETFSDGGVSAEAILRELDFEVVRIGQDWTAEEVEATVRDYFNMLRAEAFGLPYNKAEHNEHLRRQLTTRSKSSIELKHQNISAVLDQLGLPYIRGYKPRTNLQELLRRTVFTFIDAQRGELAKMMDSFDAQTEPAQQQFRGVLVARPTVEPTIRIPKRLRLPRKLDYAAREERNRQLGHAGEAWTVSFEKFRLHDEGRDDLAGRVDWIADRIGDGAGYDILSYESVDQARFIEVKTTNGGPLTSFIVTRNELEFSEEVGDAFCLYRLFEFATSPKLFILRGTISSNLELEAVDYRARLKATA
ncbi:DUF3883 domain-containing protein [Herbaspirillum huttiense]|uniref:DUF3883 domain-containing protein n=1 Tax=Herbaspirillum huttiense TaxID=863372 RepID=UPI0039B0107B